MNPIFQALAQGHGEEEILNHLIKKIPKLAPRVRKAKKQGYSTGGILSHLSQKMEREAGEDFDASSSVSERQKERKREVTKQLVSSGLKLGGMAFGAGLLARMAPQMLSRFPALQRFLGGAAPKAAETATAPVAEAMGAEVAGVEALGATLADKKASHEIFKRRGGYGGQGKLIDSLAAQATDDQVVNAVKKLHPTLLGDLEKEFGKPGEQIIKEAAQYAREGEKIPGTKIDAPEVGKRVITEEGDFGTIEKLPGKTAKVDVDGKKKIIKSENLTPIPDNEDEVLDLYERLMEAIPEEHRSGPLNWVGYESGTNRLQFKFNDGTNYMYDEIPESFIKDMEEVNFLAKTTGGNFYGNWSEGDPSRGAGMFKLIQKLQKERGGKGKEYSGKFKQVYSRFEYPEKLLKEKQQRIKEEKKRAKKAKKK